MDAICSCYEILTVYERVILKLLVTIVTQVMHVAAYSQMFDFFRVILSRLILSRTHDHVSGETNRISRTT